MIDRHGHALVYGTSNGSLIREKESGDRYRDVFVLRLHRDDGSYQSLLEPPSTSAPNGSGTGGSSGETPSTTKPAMTHSGATKDGSSVNYTIVGFGLAIPVVLSIIILLATSRNRPEQLKEPSSTNVDADASLVVDFPTATAETSPRRSTPHVHAC